MASLPDEDDRVFGNVGTDVVMGERAIGEGRQHIQRGDGRRRHRAIVRADGSLASGSHSGSIHRVGALVQGADACNGWTFWHAERQGHLRLIDELRAEIRARG